MARPLPWSAVRGVVCRAAGLDEGTVLYRGIGPVEDSWIVGLPPILAGCLLSTTPDDELRGRPPLALTVVAGPDAGRDAPIDVGEIVVGRSMGANLTLTDAAVSWRHASITPVATGLSVADLGSTNGVFVDGRPVRASAIATTGSVIRVGNSVLQIQLVAEPVGTYSPDGQGHVMRVGRPVPRSDGAASISARPAEPNAPPHRALPVLSALIGAAVGGALALVMRNPLHLAFAAFGPVTMVGSAVSDRIRGRRSYRRQRRDFRVALELWTRDARAAADANRRRAWRRWPGPAELVRRAEVGSARLWNESVGDGVRLAVGSGMGPLSVGAGHVNEALVPQASDQHWVCDVPVTMVLGREAGDESGRSSRAESYGVIGFVGSVGRGVARYLVAQIACHYSPADVAMVFVANGDDLAACVDLPHAERRVDPSLPFERTMSGIRAGVIVVILDGSAAIISPFGSAALAAAASGGPFGAVSSAIAGGRTAASGAPRATVAVLCLADTRDAMPQQAVDVAAVAAASGPVTVTAAGADLLRRVCRALAPLRDGANPDAAPLSDRVDLASLIGRISVAELRRRWAAPTARAVIGHAASGEVIVDFDRDGPHFLIAGTTGSGKSELLQTLITSLAVAASPREITFLLVDYKGGSAFGAIDELPHVVGVLTDLDPDASARALASMRAELRRRERLAAAGAARPARLVVVIDEFATLAVELPDFLAGVLDIAQRGRSLGLHLVLATQRPAGVVSPAMRANISARICLRVTDPVESLDVIGSPEAAWLPADRPGRAISRIDGRVIEFQAALVSVPVPREATATATGSSLRPATGAPLSPLPQTHDRPASAQEPGGVVTILRTVIDAARAAAAGTPPPDRPWLPPLPSRIHIADVGPEVLAVADVPDHQVRRPLPAPDACCLVLGPPGSGRSTALRRIAVISAAAGHELIVIDASGGLAGLARSAQVSTYLTLREPRLITRALALLADPAMRPADQHLRHVIVDHVDLVIAELERVDFSVGSTSLTELVTRGAGTVRISASGPERLRHQRAAAGFTEIIEMDGGAIPGRGTWSGLNVQLVEAPMGAAAGGELPLDPRVAGSGEGGARVDRNATTPTIRGRIVVRPLPTFVRGCNLPQPEPSRVPFGLGGDAALFVSVDLTGPGGGIIVAGPRRSGVTNTLRVLAHGAAAAGITVIDVHTALESTVPAIPGVTSVSCRSGTDHLAAALRDHRGPLLLVADHHGLADDHPAAALFERFLAVCGERQHLLLGVRSDALLRSRRGHLREAASYRCGLLLAPDQADGAILDLTLPRRFGSVSPGRGVWAHDGIPTPVQVALATDVDCEQPHSPDC